MYDPHVITKDELIEMLKPFDGHEKICIKIDGQSLPSEALMEDGSIEAKHLDKYDFGIEKPVRRNETFGATIVLEAFVL